MTADGQNTMVYDGENRVASATNGGASGTYSYDGNSLRVTKTSSGATTVYIFSGSKVIAEYASGAAPSAPSTEYIYSGAQLLATIAGSSTTYHHPDHLSVRLSTDVNGNVSGQQGHFPFGESWYSQSTTTKWQFTSYERDSESGNDYAMMRYSVNRLGRFSSVDPIAGTIGNPQSNNAYTYTQNDPINLVDPSGAFLAAPPFPGLPFSPFPDFPFFMGEILPCGAISGGDPFGDSNSSDPSSSGLNRVSSNCYATGNGLGQGGGGGRDCIADPLGAGCTKQPPPPVDPIWNALSNLQKLLANDPDCLSFLNSSGVDALSRLATIMDGYYGQAGMLPTKNLNGTWSMINAVSFGYPGQLVTVNTVGAFFAGQLGTIMNSTDRHRITGGTPAARGFILLHELGHNTNVLSPDANNQSIVDANDKQLEQHCSKTIKAFSH